MTLRADVQAGQAQPPGIKQVPGDPAVRQAIRTEALELAAALRNGCAPTIEQLEDAARDVLQVLQLPEAFLGFAMVAVDNAYWADVYSAVPTQRRLLLLPKCLRDQEACAARIDSIGLHCDGCGACDISRLKADAEALGYGVIVAEGTTSVLMRVLDGEADAILGVACLDSLEKSFGRIADLGIPHQAIPLLRDGCCATEVECSLVRAALNDHRRGVVRALPTYLPLLREARRVFEPQSMNVALDRWGWSAGPAPGHALEALAHTDTVARQFLETGGKRLRPFITLAAYAVGKHGAEALDPAAPVSELIPDSVRCLALAFEALHKASLVHDDIEDRDAFRYGEPTLHRTHGVEAAINVGDYLVGLGYRLVAAQAPSLGAECVADVLQLLSSAHLEMCSGQGAELLWTRNAPGPLRAVDALQIAALKTAPAFAVALYGGLRAAGVNVDEDRLRQFSAYVGEGFQIADDLDDWEDADDEARLGQDALAGRPTILRALAHEAGGGAQLTRLEAERTSDAEESAIRAVRDLYRALGVFERAAALYEGLRRRALQLAGEMADGDLQALFTFLVRIVLPPRQGVRS
jgi:geranylgeranyl diphosphate synthase type II